MSTNTVKTVGVESQARVVAGYWLYRTGWSRWSSDDVWKLVVPRKHSWRLVQLADCSRWLKT